MTFYVRRFWNGISSFTEDITLAKIDYNRGEAGLKQHYRTLGHCEQIHMYKYRLTRLPCMEGKEDVKINTRVYTTQKGIYKRLKITLRYILLKRVLERLKVTLRYTLTTKV